MFSRQENRIFSARGSLHGYRAFFWLIFAVWTVAAGAFLQISLNRLYGHALESARIQARTSIEKDIIYRRWNSMFGGVYAPLGEKLLPNPYLDLKNRDLDAGNGLRLTKINPAYMTRQVHELGETASGLIGHITSLNPIRPENKADDWEREALDRIERHGAKEVSGVRTMDGKEYMRLMIPLVTEESCLKCHAAQGYKAGDVRGGISVSVPLGQVMSAALAGRRGFVGVTLLAWALGGLMIYSAAGLKKAELGSRLNEKKYRTLVETMGEGIVYLDQGGFVLFCNFPFARMLGYDPDELRSMPFHRLLNEDGFEEYSSKVDGLPNGKLDSFELPLRRKNGGEVTVLFSPRILRSELNESTGLLAVTTDISRLKKMEHEMLRQQRLSSVGMLAGGIAHEISAPLKYLEVNSAFLRRAFAALNNLVGNMKQEGHGGAESGLPEAGLEESDLSAIMQEVPGVLDENDSSIMHISDIVASISELATTGPAVSEPEDINSLIRQCVDITHSTWDGIAVMDLDLAPNLPAVSCISRDIIHVLITVIINAVEAITIRHSGSDIVRGTIRIASGRVGSDVRIVISDNGIGIPRENLGRIFEPFFSTKKQGKGTGQGLAVAGRIMSEHHGSISAESYEKKGAVFVISLPLRT
ncbi:DUF3365 domain-containing protein [Maridesulfovibrio sp.]|uniref:c-type heme family protein n=1 Tax=Maridesulfovibrio sp. TaxID=2795000 RepID=UPI002A18BC98|nr:DUF3365 domain-containing protein [Maridesulfovibrio sp.]